LQNILKSNFNAGLLIGAEIYKRHGQAGLHLLIEHTKNDFILSILDQLEISWLGICGFTPISRELNSLNSLPTVTQARMGLVIFANVIINKEPYNLLLGINSSDILVIQDKARESLTRSVRGLAHTFSESGAIKTLNFQKALIEFDGDLRFICPTAVATIVGYHHTSRPGAEGLLGLSRQQSGTVVPFPFSVAELVPRKSLYMMDNEGFLTIPDLSIPTTITFNLPEEDAQTLEYTFVPSPPGQSWMAKLQFIVNGKPRCITSYSKHQTPRIG
jgi:hypothetical protein